MPKTADITLSAAADFFHLHKFILSSRSPYFRRKFADAPETETWKLSNAIPVEAFRVVLRYLYLGEIPRDLVGPRSTVSEEEVFKGIDKLCKQLELDKLWEAVLSLNDRRLARQRHQDEVERAQSQVEAFFRDTVLKHKMVVDTRKVNDIKWPHDNAIFANCILQADEVQGDEENQEGSLDANNPAEDSHSPGFIPIGLPREEPASQNRLHHKKPKKSVLFPVHKAFLIRSPYFETMFSSEFKEAKDSQYLHIIKVDCTPEVLEIILTFLYTEKADCPLEHALDLLYTSDMLLLDKLKTKAAIAISTLGSGTSNALVDRTHGVPAAATAIPEGGNQGKELEVEPKTEVEVEPINVYDVIRAAWDLNVQRLEEFAARYLASRLEDYIDEQEFQDLIQESASRIKERQETDTIELLDDIRYYLSERFRFRFEGDGLEEMLDEDGEINNAAGSVDGLLPVAGGVVDESLNGAQPREMQEIGDLSVGETKDANFDNDNGGGGGGGGGGFATLDGELVEDEFASDAINYQILLRKIDDMLERLKLDA